MVETLIVLLTICFLLFGILQLGQAFVSRTILNHAAARAARARTVGLNHFMCDKVMRVAAIPNAGKMTMPDDASFEEAALRAARAQSESEGEFWDWSLAVSPSSQQGEFERARIPDYLASENSARASYILDYDKWDTIHGSGLGGGLGASLDDDIIEVDAKQRFTFDIMFEAMYDWVGLTEWLARNKERKGIDKGKDVPYEVLLKGKYEIENHYRTYLDDKGY